MQGLPVHLGLCWRGLSADINGVEGVNDADRLGIDFDFRLNSN